MTTFEGPPLSSPGCPAPSTLGAFVIDVAARFGPREAVVLDDPLLGGSTVRWTYERLAEESHRIAGALLAAGVGVGDTVGIVMGNRPEALAAIFGAALAGAVAAPMSTFATRPELQALFERCRPRVLLAQTRLLDRRLGADVTSVAGTGAERVAVLGEPSWDELLAGAAAVPDAAVEERAGCRSVDDPALVICTSGTTSEPKAILHAHRSPTLQFRLQARIFGRDEGSRVFSALPLFWTAGLNTAVGSTLAAGGCWVAQETFDAGAALGLMARERVTEPYTLPHQTAALAEHPDWESVDLSSLRCVYGKGAYARHPTVRGDTGWIMPVGYGLSETCAFVSAHPSHTPRERARIGHGDLLPGVRLRVLDPATGRELGPGEPGELAVAGPTLMLGYLGRGVPRGLDEDGFFRTGDAGHVDPDGNLHYQGRRTEMIKTAGANVSPAEVEVQLRACPPVKLSRVVGVPDERLGQVVVACVVLRDGQHATEDGIRSFLRDRVAAYKVPRHVLFLEEREVPMTGGDAKVRDDGLVRLVQERLGAVGAASEGGP